MQLGPSTFVGQYQHLKANKTFAVKVGGSQRLAMYVLNWMSAYTATLRGLKNSPKFRIPPGVESAMCATDVNRYLSLFMASRVHFPEIFNDQRIYI